MLVHLPKVEQSFGYGVLKIKGHPTYEGEFKAGKKNGKGVLIYPDGNREEGTWENDNKVS